MRITCVPVPSIILCGIRQVLLCISTSRPSSFTSNTRKFVPPRSRARNSPFSVNEENITKSQNTPFRLENIIYNPYLCDKPLKRCLRQQGHGKVHCLYGTIPSFKTNIWTSPICLRPYFTGLMLTGSRNIAECMETLHGIRYNGIKNWLSLRGDRLP